MLDLTGAYAALARGGEVLEILDGSERELTERLDRGRGREGRKRSTEHGRRHGYVPYDGGDLQTGRLAAIGNDLGYDQIFLQQLMQFGSAGDWPFGAAMSFVLMAVMLAGTLIYFRVGGKTA